MKSEYDYGSKKKFVDVLGNVSISAKLQRLRAQHEIDKASSRRGVAAGAGSIMKESSNSRVASYKTYSKSNKSRYSKQSSSGCSHKNNGQLMQMN